MRTIVLHGHIFKNVGSTLDWALRRNFGDAFVDHRDDKSMRLQGTPYLESYLNQRPWVRALSSHHLCHPPPELADTRVVTLYLLRHPIERALSVYRYERHQGVDTPGARHARALDINAYMEWRLDPSTAPTLRDFHAVYLAGRWQQPLRPLGDADLAAAHANLTQRSTVGVVERFDESMLVFEAVLRPDIPQIDLSYVRQNVGGERGGTSLEARLDRLRSLLAPDVYRRLVAANQHDLELYRVANEVLDGRLASSGGSGRRTADYELGRRDTG